LFDTHYLIQGKIVASYSEMIAQIEELKKQAERQRKEEYSSVIKTIKKQIADYGITAEELGLSAAPGAKRGRKAGKATAKPGRKPGRKGAARGKHPSAGTKVAPRYKDEAGNTWTGRGKQPKWVVAAVAAGRSLESLLIR
jgi:DNA-binding protein H-NS